MLKKIDNIAFLVFHPIRTARTIVRQMSVETFPNLSLRQASELLRRPHTGGGITLGDWSANDQERMLRGEKPIGVPQHRNI